MRSLNLRYLELRVQDGGGNGYGYNFVPWSMLRGNIDFLHSSIRKLSYNLTELILIAAPFSSELFWRTEPSDNPLYWPHLKVLAVGVPTEMADGAYALIP